jgi:glycosyltransferase involved in cell wall biosynthesis
MEKIIRTKLPHPITKDIVIVDDCSTDDTAEVIRQVKENHPNVHIQYIKHPQNRGKGYAVRTGIQHAVGEVIIIQDADMEYDPDDYTALLQPILRGEYKVVYGSRILNRDNNFSYFSFYLGGRLVSLVTSLLYGQRITDEPTCYKMFDATLLKSVPLTSDRFGFCPEVTAKVLRLGYRIKELPIRYYPRSKKEGKKIRWKDGVEAIAILVKYKFGNQWKKRNNQTAS